MKFLLSFLSFIGVAYCWKVKENAKKYKFTLSSSAAAQFAAQRNEAAKRLKEEETQRIYHSHLSSLGDGPVVPNSISDPNKWLKYASKGITINNKCDMAEYKKKAKNILKDNLDDTKESLDYRGFTEIPSTSMDWENYGVDLAAIAETMDRLTADGWPAVFIFLYDQPWKLSMRLFDLMPDLLSDAESVLEASMYAWALEKPEKIKKGEKLIKKEKVGANFGVPHRDITYKNCHSPIDGSPDILSIWIPLVEMDTSNGCMFVIPREKDPQFGVDEVPKDQDPFSFRFPYADIKPLAPISAGTTLVWHPNLIHWGGACSPSSPLPPRKSIAMAFRVRDSRRPSTPKELERYGRKPFAKTELLEGGPDFKARLKMIAKSLILYNVWYPEYDGFNINKVVENSII